MILLQQKLLLENRNGTSLVQGKGSTRTEHDRTGPRHRGIGRRQGLISQCWPPVEVIKKLE